MASPRKTKLSASRFGETLRRFGYGLKSFENGVEFGNRQNPFHCFVDCGEFEIAAAIANRSQQRNQNAQARAMHPLDFCQIKHEIFYARIQQLLYRILHFLRVGSASLQLPGEIDDRDLTHDLMFECHILLFKSAASIKQKLTIVKRKFPGAFAVSHSAAPLQLLPRPSLKTAIASAGFCVIFFA